MTPAGYPENGARPKNDTKKSIRLLFGAPGRNPRANKSINGPHGQGALKKTFMHENLVRKLPCMEGPKPSFYIGFSNRIAFRELFQTEQTINEHLEP